MRDLYSTTQFDKDLDKVKKVVVSTNDSSRFNEEISLVVGRLLFKVKLEPKYKDHQLTGDWVDYRDCHIFNDLILIYRTFDKKKPHKTYGENALVLMRIGTHSELFGK